jgi:poly-beta-1,6-N-acetyl-D-glucosamine synthase
MKCSIGVFACNEEKNIENNLKSLLSQKLNRVEIDEIIVLVDGRGDNTADIVSGIASQDKRIKPVVSKERKGKSNAINRFLNLAKNDILVMVGGDTILDKAAMENLVEPFFDFKVGMTGGHPVPLNRKDTLMGFTAHLVWSLHHKISLETPKMGELTSFRRLFSKIPDTAVDEAFIEAVIKEKGHKLVYAPKAIVYNKGAETIKDFLIQRRRIHCGHYRLKKQTGHSVSTADPFKIIRLLFKNFRFSIFIPASLFLEGLARFLGWWDYATGKDHKLWQEAKSTKKLK